MPSLTEQMQTQSVASLKSLGSVGQGSSSRRAMAKSREEPLTAIYPTGLQPRTQTLVECLKSLKSQRFITKTVPAVLSLTASESERKIEQTKTVTIHSRENSISFGNLRSPKNAIQIVNAVSLKPGNLSVQKKRATATSAKKQHHQFLLSST